MKRGEYFKMNEELYHFGIPRRSGRYPWGSGDRPFQSSGGKVSVSKEERKKAKRAAKADKRISKTAKKMQNISFKMEGREDKANKYYAKAERQRYSILPGSKRRSKDSFAKAEYQKGMSNRYARKGELKYKKLLKKYGATRVNSNDKARVLGERYIALVAENTKMTYYSTMRR